MDTSLRFDSLQLSDMLPYLLKRITFIFSTAYEKPVQKMWIHIDASILLSLIVYGFSVVKQGAFDLGFRRTVQSEKNNTSLNVYSWKRDRHIYVFEIGTD